MRIDEEMRCGISKINWKYNKNILYYLKKLPISNYLKLEK